MEKAFIKQPFSVLQWHGIDYPYYNEDADEKTFKKGDEIIILHEATPNPMGKLYVVYNERINESAVIHEDYIEFIAD